MDLALPLSFMSSSLHDLEESKEINLVGKGLPASFDRHDFLRQQLAAGNLLCNHTCGLAPASRRAMFITQSAYKLWYAR